MTEQSLAIGYNFQDDLVISGERELAFSVIRAAFKDYTKRKPKRKKGKANKALLRKWERDLTEAELFLTGRLETVWFDVLGISPFRYANLEDAAKGFEKYGEDRRSGNTWDNRKKLL